MSQAQRKPKLKRVPGDLMALILIRQGANHYQALADLMNRSTTSTYQRVERLRLRGLVKGSQGHQHTLQLTAKGRAAITGYVLIPGGVGKVEKVEPIQLELGA